MNNIRTIVTSICFTLALLAGTPQPVFAAEALAGGDILWLVVAGVLFGVCAYCAARWRSAARALRQVRAENHQLSQLLDTTSHFLLLLDTDFTVVQANRAAAALLGKEGSISGCWSLEDIDIGCTPERRQEDLRALGEHGVVQHTTSLRRHGEVNSIPVRETIISRQVESTKLILCLAEDQTARIELEDKLEKAAENLRRTQEAAEAASRMKSEFIANMNHEIRTPMNAIIGYTEMLAGSDLGEREKRFVEIIYRSGISLVSILNDIMDLSKLEAGRMKIVRTPVRLVSIIEDVNDLFASQIQAKQLSYRCDIAENIPAMFLMDGPRIKQILQNLMSNAVKFTDQGTIALNVDAVHDSGDDDSYTLQFSVKDTGIGIPEQDQETIFEFFQQYDDKTARQFGGLGLGLTLCGRLVSIMGGSIQLESAPGRGSTFTFRLPGIRAVAETQIEQQAVNPAASAGAAKLLVVDDMELIIDVFLDYFRDSPVEILTASNGEDALEVATREKPSVIFMDLNLVGMNGRETTIKLKNNPKTEVIPVVVMTGHLLEEDDYRPLFDAILQKPFHLDRLKEMVGRYIDLSSPARKPQMEAEETPQSASEDSWIRGNWTPSLEHLLARANSSGSLSAAFALGEALVRDGEACGQERMIEMGRKMVKYARDPDILGVDKLLALLTRSTR